MTAALLTALCQSVALPASAAGGAPDWVHLLPAGEIATVDHRGPYRLDDAAAIVRASMQLADRLPIDENHATDLAAPQGGPSPARGWIVALEARQDGIWGQVEWTDEGRALVAGHAYRHISPVITHDRDQRVTGLLRAALVNRPNLRGLAALHAEGNSMEQVLAKLKQMLGLAADAEEGDIWTALGAVISAAAAEKAKNATALQAALAPIAKAAGLKDDADQATILGAVTALAADAARAADDKTVAALQAELATVTTQLNALSEGQKKERATAFIDGEIRKGRVGVKAMRERYVAMHMADPAGTEQLVNALPILGSGLTTIVPPAREGEVALNSAELEVARILNIPADKFAAAKRHNAEV